jgi:hypothetical protein
MSSILPMDPATLSALLSMTGTGNGWPTKARIVGLVGSFEGGEWFTANQVATFVGKSPGRTRVLLAELAAERVIVRDGGDGDRVFWCEVRADWRAWRGVPWAHPVEVVRANLALHGQQALRSPWERFIARPMYARCASVIARLRARDEALREAAEVASSRGYGPRDDGGGGGTSSRGLHARSRGKLRLVQGRAMSGAGAPGVVPPGVGSTSSPPHGPVDGFAEEEVVVDPRHEAAAKRAVFARTMPAPGGRRFVNGPPLQLLRELLERHGVEAFLAGCVDVPADTYLVPHFLEHLAVALDAPADAAPPVDVDEQRRRLEAKRAGYQQQLAIFETEGVDDELAASIRAVIGECDDGLRALEQGAATA